MKKYYLALWIIMVVNSVYSQTLIIYKWIDANGNVHFSDKSHPGAEEIELPKVQTYSVPTILNPNKDADLAADVQVTDNFKISIAQPEDQATIRNPQGSISVIVEIKPKLQEGYKVQIIVDEEPIGEPQATTFFNLQDITRGSHTLMSQLIDSKGNILKKSAAITVYMMPPRKGMVRNQ